MREKRVGIHKFYIVEEDIMKKEGFDFFQNRACEYFPCHTGVAEEEFNCLFCYCPLYLLGEDCGGNFEYLPNGIKNCDNCTVPHCKNGYAHVMEKYLLIAERIRENAPHWEAS